ncbi:MAG: S8 family serine peptidase [Opitutae bacterium]|nr:S8 family serine peptidase [Opitutae bacterium]
MSASKRPRLLALLFLATALVRAAAPADLFTAASNDDVARIGELVAAGANLEATDSVQNTPLMLAAQQGNFGALRELLRLGADPAHATSGGQTALALIDPEHEDARACRLLLRAYAYLSKNARPSTTRPSRPHLVVLFEPTVNYLHPALRSAYYVNPAERDGRPGVDDDRNGFVDDVYGWNLATDRPHEISPLQLQIYLQSRDTIGRLFKAYNEFEQGRLDQTDYDQLRAGFDNPLAKIFGRHAGFTNGDFLDRAIELSHGSHVAGIVLEHSRGQALLHTLSWESFGDAQAFTRPPELTQLAGAASDVVDFLARYRATLLDESLAAGRRLSDYLRTTGAGVVNLSMTADYHSFARTAADLASRYLEATHATAEQIEAARAALPDLAFDCYVAHSVQFLLPIYENPDVLFVIASGNDGTDNDANLPSPAYLSRFMPNAVAVAAVDAEGTIAAFSNYGERSVDLGAPGVKISSTAIPEASVLMNGTSMAAPAVAGAAAGLRHARPDLTAEQLKLFLLYTARYHSSLAHRTTTGGSLNGDLLFQLAGDSSTRAKVCATAAIHAAQADQHRLPAHFIDADRLSRLALATDDTCAEAWRARAAYFDLRDDPAAAVEPIERAIQLDPTNWHVWNSSGIIHAHLKHHAEAATGYRCAAELSAHDPNVTAPTRAAIFVRAATQSLAAGDRADASAAVRAARALHSDVSIPDDLADLELAATDVPLLILKNLRQLAAAANQYYRAQSTNTARFDDLVGPEPGKTVKQVISYAGEDYRTIVFQQDQPIVVRTRAGEEIRYQN